MSTSWGSLISVILAFSFFLGHSSHRVLVVIPISGSLGREGHSVVDEVLDGLQQLADGLGEGRASGDGVVNIDDLVERLDGVVQGRDGELSLGGLVGCLGDHGCVLVVVRLEVG